MVTLPSQLRKAAQNLPLLRSRDIQEPFASLHRVLASLPQLTPEFRIKKRVNEKAGISRDKRAPETRWPAGHKYVVLTELFLPCRKVLCISFSVDLISSFPKLSREFQVSFLYYFLEKKIESMERYIGCESNYREGNGVSSYLQQLCKYLPHP